jgi:hypothetical protein
MPGCHPELNWVEVSADYVARNVQVGIQTGKTEEKPRLPVSEPV